MRSFLTRKLSIFFSVLLCFVTASQFVLPVQADDPENENIEATGITYQLDDEAGFYIGHISAELSVPEISVPDGCHLVMDDDTGENHLPDTTVTIESGGIFEIFGTASFAGTIIPSDGACMSFEGESNIPESVVLYDAGGEAVFDTAGVADHRFIYLGGESKWIDFEEEPVTFDLNLGGYDPEYDSVVIQYKYTGQENYTEAEYNSEEDSEYPGNFFGNFELADIPENWDGSFDINITLTSNRTLTPVIMAYVDNGNDNMSSGISDDGNRFSATIDTTQYSGINISLGYPDSGDPAITEKADDYLYAYYADDADGVKALFAEELICRLMDPSLFDYFGMPEITGESDEEIAAVREANVNTMISRIEASGEPYNVTVKDTHGNESTRSVQNYKVNWGNNGTTGEPVTSTIPVYTLSSVNEILICMDFNDENGTGSQFMVCDVDNDLVSFSDGIEDSGIKFLVDNIDPGKIKTGGMGHYASVINDNGIYTVEVNAGGPANFLRVHDSIVSYGRRIRFLKNSEKYLAIGGSGENKEYGLIGDNGKYCDSIWATGADDTAEARVYVGDSTIHLYPLSGSTGLSGTQMTSVALADPSQADGVTLDTSNLNDVTLSFASNFYDEIPLTITFEDGATKNITIFRVGLVIYYTYLGGDPNYGGEPDSPIVDNGEIIMDYYGQNIPFNYSYFGGEHIAVWATFYHPTNDLTNGADDYMLYLTFDDGSHRVVTADDTSHNFNGRLSATDDKVASTTFLIGFEQGYSSFDDVWVGQLNETDYHEGGFSATVLNAGYDDNTTYSGTQMGSGKGVYWDGHISFY